MKIRRLSPADRDACAAVSADREWNTPLAQWEMLLRYGQGYGLDNGTELAGTVIAFAHDGLTFIGMMLIRKNVERRGFGRALLEHALEELSQPAALIATPLGRPLYEKLGFVERETIAIHEGTWHASMGNDALVQDVDALSWRRIASIAKTDAQAFGCRRDRLIFGALGMSARIAIVDDGDHSWYALASANGDTIDIGPIVARDEDMALQLIAALVSRGDKVRVRAVASRTTLRNGINDAGLHVQRALPLMVRGDFPLPAGAWCAAAFMATG